MCIAEVSIGMGSIPEDYLLDWAQYRENKTWIVLLPATALHSAHRPCISVPRICHRCGPGSSQRSPAHLARHPSMAYPSPRSSFRPSRISFLHLEAIFRGNRKGLCIDSKMRKRKRHDYGMQTISTLAQFCSLSISPSLASVIDQHHTPKSHQPPSKPPHPFSIIDQHKNGFNP